MKPPVFRSPEVERVILDGLASGQSLRRVFSAPALPEPAAVVQWMQRDEEFRRRYLEARQCGAQ
jgi:hypothetical protein